VVEMQATCSQPVAMPNLTANVPTVDAVRMHSGLADDWDEHTESNILAAFDPAHEEHGHDMTAVTAMVCDLLTESELHCLFLVLAHSRGVPVIV
jgi:hypothetical protein